MSPVTKFAKRRATKQLKRITSIALAIVAAVMVATYVLPHWLHGQPGETAMAAGRSVTSIETIHLDCRARAVSRFYAHAFQDRDTIADLGEVPLVNKLPLIGDAKIQAHNAAGVLLGVVGDLETCVEKNAQSMEVEDGVMHVKVYYIDFNRPRLDLGVFAGIDAVESCVDLIGQGELEELAHPDKLDKTKVVCADQEFMTGSTDSNRLIKLQQSLLQYTQALVANGHCLDEVQRVTENSIRQSYIELADEHDLTLELDLSDTALRYQPIEFPEVEGVNFAASELVTCELADT